MSIPKFTAVRSLDGSGQTYPVTGVSRSHHYVNEAGEIQPQGWVPVAVYPDCDTCNYYVNLNQKQGFWICSPRIDGSCTLYIYT